MSLFGLSHREKTPRDASASRHFNVAHENQRVILKRKLIVNFLPTDSS